MVYYAKERMNVKDKFDSKSAYKKCAKKLLSIDEIIKLLQDSNTYINDIWGWQMFQSSCEGQILGCSPSFWISVRMNIYMSLTAIKFTDCPNYLELDV